MAVSPAEQDILDPADSPFRVLINNGKLAQSMRMSLPAALVRSLGLMRGMTAYIKVHVDGTFTVYPNKPPSDT